jgi:hypothetical protein
MSACLAGADLACTNNPALATRGRPGTGQAPGRLLDLESPSMDANDALIVWIGVAWLGCLTGLIALVLWSLR